VLGGGAYGVVCKAVDSEGHAVAIKRIPGVLKDAQEARRALREVRLLKHFKASPHVVDFLDVVKAEDGGMSSLLLVFELMDGTLHSLLQEHKNQGLPGAKRKDLLFQLLLGMRDLHSIDVIHRDLRPKNLLLKGDKLKLCDFGMARKVSLRMSLLCYTTCSAYCAPEGMLANNNAYSTASDMWSIGCIFFEMIYGRRLLQPIQGANTPLHRMVEVLGVPSEAEMDAMNIAPKYREMSTSWRHEGPMLTAQHAPLFDLMATAAEDERDLLLRMLKYDPADRLTAEEALHHEYFEGRAIPDVVSVGPFDGDEPTKPLISDIQREMRRELMGFASG